MRSNRTIAAAPDQPGMSADRKAAMWIGVLPGLAFNATMAVTALAGLPMGPIRPNPGEYREAMVTSSVLSLLRLPGPRSVRSRRHLPWTWVAGIRETRYDAGGYLPARGPSACGTRQV